MLKEEELEDLEEKNLKPSANTSEVSCQASTFMHPQIFSWKEDEMKTKATIVGCGDALEKEIENFRQTLIQNQNEDIFLEMKVQTQFDHEDPEVSGLDCLILKKSIPADKKAYELKFFYVTNWSYGTLEEAKQCGNDWLQNGFQLIQYILRQTKSPAFIEVEFQNLQNMNENKVEFLKTNPGSIVF